MKKTTIYTAIALSFLTSYAHATVETNGVNILANSEEIVSNTAG
jgi:hypothetical protein